MIGDDTGMRELLTGHFVASSDADTIQQWFNAGGQVQFYDYPLSKYRNVCCVLNSQAENVEIYYR